MQFTPRQLEKLGYKESSQNSKMQSLIKSSFKILRNRPTTKSEFFRFLAATNLLNALVKLPENKGILSYGFKNYLARVLADIIMLRRIDLFDSIHYEDNCFYIRCYSLHFSFHNVIKNQEIIDGFITTGLDSNEKWDGLKLQRHAEAIFNLAHEIIRLNSEEKRHKKVAEFKLTISDL